MNGRRKKLHMHMLQAEIFSCHDKHPEGWLRPQMVTANGGQTDSTAP